MLWSCPGHGISSLYAGSGCSYPLATESCLQVQSRSWSPCREKQEPMSDSRSLGVKSSTNLGTEGMVTHGNAPSTTREGRRARFRSPRAQHQSLQSIHLQMPCHFPWESWGHKVTTRGTNQGTHRRECSLGQSPAGLLALLPCLKEGCPLQQSPGPWCSLCFQLSVFSSQGIIMPSCLPLHSLTDLLEEATISLHMALLLLLSFG